MRAKTHLFIVSKGGKHLGHIVYRSALFLALTQATAHAQIVNTQPIVNGVGDITRQVERITDSVQQRAKETIAETTGTVAAVSDSLKDADPLAALPSVLPVVNLAGSTVFNDVQVENGWRAVDRQWLIMIQPDELAALQQPDIEVLEQTYLEDLDTTLVRFSVPDALNTRPAVQNLLPPALRDRVDRNHIYNPQKKFLATEATGSQVTHQGATRGLESIDRGTNILCDNPLRIGMVDTAIQVDHPAFANHTIIEKDFLGDQFAHPQAHGTAVAGLLIGASDELVSRLPNATLYNASVFYSQDQYAQGATMMHLVKGLNWLLENDVTVINMSLAGPDNRILATLVEKAISKNRLIVAAAGNEGPAAPPVYPAAYPNVISVTAVDKSQRVYRWANQGDFIDFSAIGVSVLTTRSDGQLGHESGTSMAAPTVTAYAACELANNGGDVNTIINHLAKKAVDVGHVGRDPVFGYGLLY